MAVWAERENEADVEDNGGRCDHSSNRIIIIAEECDPTDKAIGEWSAHPDELERDGDAQSETGGERSEGSAAHDSQAASMSQILASALGVVSTVEHDICAQLKFLEPTIHAADTDSEPITAQVQKSSALCISVLQVAIGILYRTDFAVAEPMKKGCLVPSMRPDIVITAESLWPSVSRFWIRSVVLRAIGATLWVSGLAAFLLWFRVVSGWWLAIFPGLSVPGIVSFVLCFNRKVLWHVCQSFQTAILCWYTVVLFSCFGVLWRNEPARLAAFVFYMQTFIAAIFIDAYPEVRNRFKPSSWSVIS
jgi:hypothetical protein